MKSYNCPNCGATIYPTESRCSSCWAYIEWEPTANVFFRAERYERKFLEMRLSASREMIEMKPPGYEERIKRELADGIAKRIPEFWELKEIDEGWRILYIAKLPVLKKIEED